MNAQEFYVIKPHVSVGRFVYFKPAHHVNLDEIKHYLDFIGLFPLSLHDLVLVRNRFYFFCIYMQLDCIYIQLD
jgi:hypothetical protein